MFALGGAVFGGMILFPLYLQQVRGLSAFETGLLLAPMGVGMIVILPLIGRQVDRHGGGRFALAGLIVTTIATIPFAFVDATHVVLVALGGDGRSRHRRPAARSCRR